MHSTLHTSAILCLFFFNDTATTEIYTLSLHDALPISVSDLAEKADAVIHTHAAETPVELETVKRETGNDKLADRKSTRLNSSHGYISYAVFCLKKKNYA